MCVWVCACVRACVHACVRVCVCACVCAYANMCTCGMCLYICTCACVCVCTCVHVCMCICVYAYVCAAKRCANDSIDLQHECRHWPLFSANVNSRKGLVPTCVESTHRGTYVHIKHFNSTQAFLLPCYPQQQYPNVPPL